jgi:hypothetical protein
MGQQPRGADSARRLDRIQAKEAGGVAVFDRRGLNPSEVAFVAVLLALIVPMVKLVGRADCALADKINAVPA